MSQYNVQFQDGNGQLAGLRNQIINGNFEIWQRGTAITGFNNAYTSDRWYAPSSGDYSLSTEGPEGLSTSISISNGPNGNIYQAVELPGAGLAGPFEVGTTWTLSFYVKVLAGTLPVYSIVAWGDDVTGSNSVIVYNDSGSPFTATTSWQRVTRTFTVANTPNSSNLCLRVLLRSDSLTQTLKYSGVQLESGPIATPFEQRPIALELSLCQRYYQSFNERIFGVTVNGQSSSSATLNCLIVGPSVTFRVIPTVISPPSGFAVTTYTGSPISCTLAVFTTNADTVLASLATTADPANYPQLRMVGNETWALDAEL